MTLTLQFTILHVNILQMRDICMPHRFAYDGEWKFADLLTMTAGKLAVKFVVDRYEAQTMTC